MIFDEGYDEGFEMESVVKILVDGTEVFKGPWPIPIEIITVSANVIFTTGKKNGD